MKNMKKYVAEFIGTMVLVAVACGVAAIVGCADAAGKVATSLSFGLVIVAMAYSIGNVSGCHINPAVSLAMLMNKKLSGKEFVGYVISQVLGAFVGALLVSVFAGDFDKIGGCVNGDGGSVVTALVAEIVLTFIFVIAIIGVTSKAEFSNVAGLVIGGALTLVHLLGTSITGTSVNPARSLGPALVYAFGGETAGLAQVWIFIAGPLVGAALAALVYSFITKEEK